MSKVSYEFTMPVDVEKLKELIEMINLDTWNVGIKGDYDKVTVELYYKHKEGEEPPSLNTRESLKKHVENYVREDTDLTQ